MAPEDLASAIEIVESLRKFTKDDFLPILEGKENYDASWGESPDDSNGDGDSRSPI